MRLLETIGSVIDNKRNKTATKTIRQLGKYKYIMNKYL